MSKRPITALIYLGEELIDQNELSQPTDAALFMATKNGDRAVFQDKQGFDMVEVQRGEITYTYEIYWDSLSQAEKDFFAKSAEQMENSFASRK